MPPSLHCFVNSLALKKLGKGSILYIHLTPVFCNCFVIVFELNVCVYVFKFVCVYECVCVCVYECVCVSVYECVHVGGGGGGNTEHVGEAVVLICPC